MTNWLTNPPFSIHPCALVRVCPCPNQSLRGFRATFGCHNLRGLKGDKLVHKSTIFDSSVCSGPCLSVSKSKSDGHKVLFQVYASISVRPALLKSVQSFLRVTFAALRFLPSDQRRLAKPPCVASFSFVGWIRRSLPIIRATILFKLARIVRTRQPHLVLVLAQQRPQSG